jgi:hypothetical protein
MRILISAILMFTLCIVVGCKEETPGADTRPFKKEQSRSEGFSPVTSGSNLQKSLAVVTASDAKADPLPNPKRTPPGPPLVENFQAAPQLRLFPWVGDFRPEIGDGQQTHWKTLIDQLVNGTSIAEDQATGSRAWVFRGIEDSSSSGYFAPLRVEPQTTYQVFFKLSADLHKGSAAGIRIIEFDEFLWIGEQYTEEQYRTHYRGVHGGKRLTGKVSGQQSITFTTGPDTHMVHLVLFREGTHDGSSSMFDDIQIAATPSHQ